LVKRAGVWFIQKGKELGESDLGESDLRRGKSAWREWVAPDNRTTNAGLKVEENQHERIAYTARATLK
jgi:hypothetical protein